MKPKRQIMYIAQLGGDNSETLWARTWPRQGLEDRPNPLLRQSGACWKPGRVLRLAGRRSVSHSAGQSRRSRPEEGRKRGSFRVEIDEDVREEYWRQIRNEPSRSRESAIYS